MAQVYNLQDDVGKYPGDLDEALILSRDNWLRRQKALCIINLHEDPTLSVDPVQPFVEGLYLYNRMSVFDQNRWNRFEDGHRKKKKITKEIPSLEYTVSRLDLNPVDPGMSRIYERRVYNLPMQESVLVHYRSINMIEGEEIEDSGSDVVDIEGDSDTSDEDDGDNNDPDDNDADDNDDSDSDDGADENDGDNNDPDDNDADDNDDSDSGSDSGDGADVNGGEEDVPIVNPLCNGHLSGIKDHNAIKLQGIITSVPKHSSETVPIKVACHKMTSDCWRECEFAEDFKPLWEKVLQIVEHQMQFPARYQLNFNVSVQEVLRSCSHLFTADEKTFLESFPSLSEDSQRLFIRLYTRKGPWFRLSNSSYSEVSDSLQALQDLPVKDANELDYQKMKEIVELLSVTDLRDILSMNKMFSDGTRLNIAKMILAKTGQCVKISSIAESLIWRVERIIFLNGEQDLSSFVLLDLGIIKYPTYQGIDSEQIFSDRTKLLAYEEAIEVAQLMDESLENEDSQTVLKCISGFSSESALVATFNCFTAKRDLGLGYQKFHTLRCLIRLKP